MKPLENRKCLENHPQILLQTRIFRRRSSRNATPKWRVPNSAAMAGCFAWPNGKPASRWRRKIVRPREESVARRRLRWAAREPGSAARECLDELLGNRHFSGRVVNGHAAVAEAVRAGWAEAGVCVRFSAAEAGLNFLPVPGSEALDFTSSRPRCSTTRASRRWRACCAGEPAGA